MGTTDRHYMFPPGPTPGAVSGRALVLPGSDGWSVHGFEVHGPADELVRFAALLEPAGRLERSRLARDYPAPGLAEQLNESVHLYVDQEAGDALRLLLAEAWGFDYMTQPVAVWTEEKTTIDVHSRALAPLTELLATCAADKATGDRVKVEIREWHGIHQFYIGHWNWPEGQSAAVDRLILEAGPSFAAAIAADPKLRTPRKLSGRALSSHRAHHGRLRPPPKRPGHFGPMIGAQNERKNFNLSAHPKYVRYEPWYLAVPGELNDALAIEQARLGNGLGINAPLRLPPTLPRLKSMARDYAQAKSAWSYRGVTLGRAILRDEATGLARLAVASIDMERLTGSALIENVPVITIELSGPRPSVEVAPSDPETTWPTSSADGLNAESGSIAGFINERARFHQDEIDLDIHLLPGAMTPKTIWDNGKEIPLPVPTLELAGGPDIEAIEGDSQ